MQSIIKSIFEENAFRVTNKMIDQTDNYFAISNSNESNKFEYYLVIFIKDIKDKELMLFASEHIPKFFSSIKMLPEFQQEMHKNLSLILCVEMDSLDLSSETRDAIYEIEEAPFYFKRYVLTYTKHQSEQLLANCVMEKLVHNQVSGYIQKQLREGANFREFKLNVEQDTEYNLIAKLFIKIPFLTVKVLEQTKLENLPQKIKAELDELALNELATIIVNEDIENISDAELLRKIGVTK